jgi:peptidoglycan/LPS O-acetylase OafA/YrhL
MTKKNNFDFLRLMFALFVIVTHSYPLTGVTECDFLCQITGNQLSFSYLGVRGFFIISGFLIFQSLSRSQTLKQFYWKRFLRLIPALAVVLFITPLLAYFVYQQAGTPYFLNKSAWFYFPLNLLIYKDYFSIDGVFENNPYPSKINGSLWTIRYEVTLYILLSVLFFIKHKPKKCIGVLGALYLILIALAFFYMEPLEKFKLILRGNYMVDLGIYFISGALLASLNFEKITHKNELWIITFLLTITSLVFHFFDLTKYVFLPIIILLFGLKSTSVINQIGSSIGDLSYGIYIYGFPVQQTLVHFFELNHLSLMALSIPITFLLAFLSWHIIEKKALSFKKWIPWKPLPSSH